MGSAGTLRLLDTSELLRPLPRKLHTAWAEIHGRKTAMSPTVAQELVRPAAGWLTAGKAGPNIPGAMQ